jgi:hypothetical protein
MFSFIETRLFTKLVVDYLSDEEYAALQLALMRDPEVGPVIRKRPVLACCLFDRAASWHV